LQQQTENALRQQQIDISKQQTETENLLRQRQLDLSEIKTGLDAAKIAIESSKLQPTEKEIALEEVEFQQAKAKLENQRLENAKIKAEVESGPKSDIKAADLRKEFNNRTEIKDFRKVDAARNKVANATSAKPSPAGDLAIIFNFMKILDPGSVVREGEFATAQNAAAVPDQIRNLYNRVTKGQRLNPDQRKDFAASAERAFQGQVETILPTIRQFTELEQLRGFDPGVVISEADRSLLSQETQSEEEGDIDITTLSDEDLLNSFR